MAVRPFPSIPSVTCSAVEVAENPDGPFQPKNHISFFAKNYTITPNKDNLREFDLLRHLYPLKFCKGFHATVMSE